MSVKPEVTENLITSSKYNDGSIFFMTSELTTKVRVFVGQVHIICLSRDIREGIYAPARVK